MSLLRIFIHLSILSGIFTALFTINLANADNSSLQQAQEPLFFAPPQAKLLTKIGQLTVGEVNYSYEDAQGYMWFATTNGLIKFDGQESKHFVHDQSDAKSISSNWLGDIIEDRFGYIWLTTQTNRLIKFDPKTETAINIDIPELKPNHRGVIALYNQEIDDQDRLWLGSSAGVHLIDIKTNKTLPLPASLSSMLKKELGKIEILADGSMIFAFLYDGFYWYKEQQLHHYTKANTDGALASDIVQAAITDSKQRIWLGTQVGLHQFIPSAKHNKDKIKRHISQHQLEDGHREYEIAAMTEDVNGHIWLGTYTAIHRFNPETEQFVNISTSPAQENQYPKTQVLNATTDSKGNLWISTRAGVLQIKSHSFNFRYITSEKADLLITDIEKPVKQQLEFVANRKLFKIDVNTAQSLPVVKAPPQLYRVDKDNNDQYWFGTVGTGLHQQTATTQGYSQPLIPILENTSDQVRGVYDVLAQNNDTIWLLALPSNTSGIGSLLRYLSNDQSYTSYWPKRTYTDLMTMDDLVIAAAHQTGLYSINMNTLEQKVWTEHYPNSPISNVHLHHASNGILWSATSNKGLAKFDPKTDKFSYYDTADGLIDNNLMAIVEDRHGILWLGSTIGISRFDPTTEQFTNFTAEDGLLFNQIRRRAGMLSENGEVIFGTNRGLVLFDPNRLAGKPKAPKVVFNDFKLFNQSVAIDKNSPLSKPIAQTKQLNLSHKDYVFSLHFSALEFLRPDQIQFAYRMKGLDEKWLYTDANNRQASYTTLSPGDYVFEVKASNTRGQWTGESSEIAITIEPPFWRTWTAYILYALTIITVVGSYIKIRTERLIQQAQKLEEQVQIRTEELQKSTEQLAQKTQTVSELLEQKRKMFSSVSHEFRTPLTLILTPIEQLLTSKQAQPFAEQLNLIRRNSKRLLRMVDQLLEFSKLEQHNNQTKAIEKHQLDIKQSYQIVCASFEPLFDSKNINFDHNIQGDGMVEVLPDSLNKILINLLSNAAKYTKTGGKVDFMVTVEAQTVEFKVTDTGIGISKADQNKIFERFSRASNHQGEAIPGAGIGLALVKELVDSNQGEITLSSELNQGSCFSVSLPLLSTTANNDRPAHNQQQIDLELETLVEQEQNNELTGTDSDNQQINEHNSQTSILVIDDNSDMRSLLRQSLINDHQILTAENGQQGIDTATRELPDLIISDVMMPLVDGYQLSQTLKNDPLTCHIPIILLSAKGSVESRIKGLENQVDDYLAKPFNITELKLRINNILTIRELMRKRNSQLLEQQLLQLKQSVQAQAEITQQQTNADEQTNDVADQLHLGNLNKADQAFCEKVYQQLEQQYQTSGLTLTSLASDLALSQRQFQRKLKAIFDSGFPELVSNFRLQKAIKLLESGHRVSNVYYEVGFSSHSYFSACFKAKYGMTPKQYQGEING